MARMLELHLRMNELERADLEALAEKWHLGYSEVVRRAVRETLAREARHD